MRSRRRPRRLPRFLSGLLLALLAVAAPPAAAPAQTVPKDFVGLMSEDLLAGDAGYRAGVLDQQSAIGVGTIRQTFHWSRIEAAPGRYELSGYDDYVAQVAARGFKLLPILFDPPAFRSARPSSGAQRGTYPPRNPADMAAFAAVLARRYGPDGTLWSDRPNLRKVPIRAWQVWNEPNLPAFWPAGPSAAEYTRLLEATAAAIKAVDPGAEIVTAGLPDSGLGIPPVEFVRGMYDAGAAAAFDTLAVHPFAADEEGALTLVAGARAVMAARGDPAPIWITESGWATGGPPTWPTVGEDGQALMIECSLTKLVMRAGELGVRGFIYWNWRDPPAVPADDDFWGLHTGLLRRDGSHKPGYAAFRDTALELETTGPGARPIACFGPWPPVPYTGETVRFSPHAIRPGGAIVSHAWDLDNDGAFDDGTSATVRRSFASEGTYVVRLRVTDSAGATDIGARTITVRRRPPSGPGAEGGAGEESGSAVARARGTAWVSLIGRAVRLTRRGSVPIRLRCRKSSAGACRGNVRLETRRRAAARRGRGRARSVQVVLGIRPFEIPGGRTARLGIRLSTKYQRLVRRRKSLRTTVIITERDEAGDPDVARVGLTVRPAKRRARR